MSNSQDQIQLLEAAHSQQNQGDDSGQANPNNGNSVLVAVAEPNDAHPAAQTLAPIHPAKSLETERETGNREAGRNNTQTGRRQVNMKAHLGLRGILIVWIVIFHSILFSQVGYVNLQGSYLMTAFFLLSGHSWHILPWWQKQKVILHATEWPYMYSLLPLRVCTSPSIGAGQYFVSFTC